MSKEIVIPEKLISISQKLGDDHLDRIKSKTDPISTDSHEWNQYVEVFMHVIQQSDIKPSEAFSALITSVDADSEIENLIMVKHLFHLLDLNIVNSMTEDQRSEAYILAGLVDWPKKVFGGEIPVNKIKIDNEKTPSFSIKDKPEILEIIQSKLEQSVLVDDISIQIIIDEETKSHTLLIESETPEKLAEAYVGIQSIWDQII